jgi:hypothetical protein
VIRRTTCAAALTAVLAAALAACGSGSDSGSDKITDAPATTAATTAAAPTASATRAAARPTVTFPSYAKDVFDGPKTGDPVKDQVLADSAQAMSATDDAIFHGSTDRPLLHYYYSDQALIGAVDFAKGYISKGEKWGGVTRFFDRKVTLQSATTAAVVFCSDESKSWITHNGKKLPGGGDTPQAYVLYNARLTKNAQGVWQTTNLLSDRGAKQCQP